MRYLFILFIKLYWRIVPKHLRRTCIFSESCSRYVKRKFENNGTFNGLKALIFRIQHCRGGYHLETDKNEIYLITAKGSKIPEINVSLKIAKHYRYVGKIKKMSLEHTIKHQYFN